MNELPSTLGSIIDERYEVRRMLGEGAEACVVEAMHLYTGRRVAIKVITTPDFPAMREQKKARLLREAKTLGRLGHAGVVEILDAGALDNGMPYVVMEYLDGRTVEGLLAARGRFTSGDAVAIILATCDAVGAAHAAGIIHRDVKPANLIVRRDRDGREQVKVIDFGMSKWSDAAPTITAAGSPVGTPAYMAPEQLLGEPIDHRVDVYAIGATLFELLAGQLPYPGSVARIVREVSSEQPPPSVRDTRADVDPALARVVLRAMAKRVADRYGSVEHLAEELRLACHAIPTQLRLLDPVDPPPRRRGPRAPYMTPIRLELEGRYVDGRTEDISEGGLLVLSREPLAPDTTVKARFALPIEGNVIEARTRVRWSIPREHGMRAAGLELIEPDESLRRSLARYVLLLTGQSAEAQGLRPSPA